MQFSKVVGLAAAVLLCFVYSGVCDELSNGLARVSTQVNPLTYKIDNDVAVANNVLGGVTAANGDVNTVTASAQAATNAVAQPFLGAVNALNTVLSPTAAASCLTNAADQIASAALTAAVGYVNCVAPIVSLVPGQLTNIQGIVTRRNDPSIVNIVSNLVALALQYTTQLLTGLADAINSAIDSAIALLNGITTDLAPIFTQAVQTAINIAACAVNVKLAETAAAINVVTGIVSCAANLSVAVTQPVLPPTPDDTTVIVNAAITAFNNFASQIASLAANIASAASAVTAVANQIAAVTADAILNAISAVVQPFISKLKALKVTYFLNSNAVADIQGGIDQLTAIQNNGVTSASQQLSQLSQQASSLAQQCTDSDNELKGHVRNKGVSAITACANNIVNNTPNYVKVCSNTLVNNTPLVLSKIQGDVDVVNAASGSLSVVSNSALSGQVAIAGYQATNAYAATLANLSAKYGITV